MATAALSSTYRRSKESEFESLGKFLVTVMRHGMGLRTDQRLELVGAAGSDEHHGGSVQYSAATVPSELARRLLRIEQPDDVLGGLTRLPMSSSRLGIPARTDKNHSSSTAGGVVVTRKSESDTVDASKMQLEQVGLSATTLAGLAFVTEEALTDSGEAMATYLEVSFEDAVRGTLINELVRGTGVGQWMGVLNSPALVTIAKEGSQAADTINGTNIAKMALQTWGYDRAIWICNPDTRLQLVQANIGVTGVARFMYEVPSGNDPRPRLLGRPIVFTEHASKLGDVGDIIAFVPSEYVVGDRSRDFVDSMHVRYSEFERCFRFTLRSDGQPWWRSALTPANGANVLSPYVTLAERA